MKTYAKLIKMIVIVSILSIFSCNITFAETPLRIMTFNAEWLVQSEDETNKDPWEGEYTFK
ncbi:MAG: hypothetical protein ACYSTS_16385 [Planctomycetota bacterium]|jgi:hypothetical protein